MRISLILIAFLFSVTAFSQDYKFGKVSKEELQEAYNTLDSSASATYLYKYRKTYFEYTPDEGFELKTEVHERIKIYNQEGFEYATKLINLYKSSESRKEDVGGLKGYTYNLVGSKIEKDKLDKSAIFKIEKSKYRNQEKFTMPNIKNGCVIEYQYTVYSPYFSNIDDYVFQHGIPIKKLEAKFEEPEFFVYKQNTRGYLTITPKVSSKMERISYMEANGHARSYAASTQNTNSGTITFSKKISSYSLSNVPALKTEAYVNNMNNYRAMAKYELAYTDFPNSVRKSYSTTWGDVVKTIYKNSSFGGELDKKGYYKADIDNLIGAVSDPIERAYLIFNYVKSKIKWNGYHGKYTDEGVKNAYINQIGNVADINLMLTSMLRYAGLTANPVLLSTRSHGVPLYPTREGYNYVVSCVKFPEGTMLLDASNKFAMPNVLPQKTLNWKGRIITEEGNSELIDLYPKEKSIDKIFMMAKLDEEGILEGAYRSVKTNHKALDFRDEYVDSDKEEFLEELENSYNGMEISDYNVKNELDLAKPITESYKFINESQADIIGDKMYFSPLFFLRITENPFKIEKREFPVDFSYPSATKYRIQIDLPETYKVESTPEPGSFMMPDNLGVFKYNISAQGNTIQLVIESHINKSIITPNYYDALKLYFSQLIEKQGEQIVLSRI